MPADMGSMDAVLKERYTPEQLALAEACKPKPKPERRVTNHLPRRLKGKPDERTANAAGSTT